MDYDDSLWVVEMNIVSPPFVVDFAGAYLDERPDFPPEVLDQWDTEKHDQFEDRWPLVKDLIAEFEKYGIHLADVKPGNIVFDESQQDAFLFLQTTQTTYHSCCEFIG